jgi:hypothetical protein
MICQWDAPTSGQSVPEFPSAQQVHMEMENHLPPLFIAVDHHPETLPIDLFDPGNLLGGKKHGLEIRHSFRIDIHQRGDVPSGDDNDVDRGCGMDVIEGQNPIILEHLPAGNRSCRDFAEYALLHLIHLPAA